METESPTAEVRTPRVRFESGSSESGERGKRKSRRSDSGNEPSFMSPLSFEEVDVKNTPLSSNRSCSEYQRQQRQQRLFEEDEEYYDDLVEENTEFNAKTARRSWWSSLFGFGSSDHTEDARKQAFSSFSSTGKIRMKLQQDSTEETLFLVEKLRFNPANLYEGEDYDYFGSENVGDDMNQHQASCFSINIGGGGSDGSHLYYHSKRHKHTGSFFGESSAAFDYLFGVKLASNVPMEIELKCFSQSKPYYHSPQRADGEEDVDHERTPICSNRPSLDPIRLSNISLTDMMAPSTPVTPASMRRIPSFRNLESGLAHQVDNDSLTNGTSIEIRIEIDRLSQSLMMRAMMQGYWDRLISTLKSYFPSSRGQDEFYESIRLQPFASGAYLRCMLLAGLSSTVFQIYNLSCWPTADEMRSVSVLGYGHAIEMFLYINLVIQIFLNVIQLPFRLRIHFLCWESSRAVEVDAAITIIRSMLQSESWLVNKALGKILDGLMIFNLIITEVYLWCSSRTDPLRGLMISLAATNMLTIVARVLVATIFSFSMHDPQVLSEARRRGLSKWDLDVLPTFVYSKAEEVNNSDCPICLCGFEMGEMLISLPCDAKHSFHASCIRQWLQRQNSCPLCQKLI